MRLDEGASDGLGPPLPLLTVATGTTERWVVALTLLPAPSSPFGWSCWVEGEGDGATDDSKQRGKE